MQLRLWYKFSAVTSLLCFTPEAVHLRNAPFAVKETFFTEDRKKLRDQFEIEAQKRKPRPLNTTPP